ncbi:hypothetical protein VPHD249_0126 [Vibrio phage D249]|nr:hypothetical protein SIPHO036v1_80013 [Vibrio phage 70E38.1]QZI88019.1 hypothetical protein SIPHO041v1_p0108 [Vibrio phage 234P1]QZI88341.1 hypothetical protein SIPHO082v1_p0064 [Vibrio phage 294E48.1]QZI88559.1 hypothetical protein SIPHO037v1_p0118 [Vibrio phage 70E35.2]QZI88743.1 hypothetical protein SIPHO039v1_p0114 [Vibrio phage 70E35.5a]QZI88926.1 hypothetical protein SIPHO040v1_p0113 [Vibrio phage 70E35.6]QZI89094.1 hypothetical protein SIPHO042v1_p0097 [Vibrio phage 70E37.1]QZI8919
MADRRKGSPWGMIQAIAASLALAVSLSVGVYTRVITDVMSEVDTLASSERLKRERLIQDAVNSLENKFELRVAALDGTLEDVEDAIGDIERDIAVIQQQQIADAEVRKLVNDVTSQLGELKGDLKVLTERSVSVDSIASQLGSLSHQMSTINKKLNK